MRVMLDLNVLLDVIQRRRPQFNASAAVLDLAIEGEIEALVPAHSLTTIHHIVQKYLDTPAANKAVDWIIGRLPIAALGHDDFHRARALDLADFEDAVVASIAEHARCQFVITRNSSDFEGGPVHAVTPAEFMALLDSF